MSQLTFVPEPSTAAFLYGFPSMGCRIMPISVSLQKNISLLNLGDSWKYIILFVTCLVFAVIEHKIDDRHMWHTHIG